MKPIEIFSEFISKELDGDIQKLLDYDLKQLKNNVVFGCPNRRYQHHASYLLDAFTISFPALPFLYIYAEMGSFLYGFAIGLK